MTSAVLRLCGVAFAASLLSAQSTPDTSYQVRMRVVALDNSGQPVTDLNATDLRLADQGKQQRITFFRTPGGKAEASHAGEFSNRGATPSAHATVVLFDLMNQSRADRTTSAKKLAKSLQQLESGDSLYLYVLGLDGTLHAIHAIPRNPAEAFAEDRQWTRQAEKLMDEAMNTLNLADPAGVLQEDVVKKTYVALENVATQISAVPGARDLIWVTNGMPTVSNPRVTCSGDWIDCGLYVPHLAVTLERAGVAVHPICYVGAPSPDVTRDIEEMAGLTGGKAWFGDDLKAALDGIATAARASYLLAYQPKKDFFDSKFHKVRLNAERNGVRLLFRQRYYAIPDQRPAPAIEQSALVGAYANAADGSAIGLRVIASAATATPNNVHLEIRIQPSDVLLAESGKNYEGQVTVLLASYTAAGPTGNPVPKTFNLKLNAEQREKALKEGIPIAQDHAIDGNVQRIRVIIYDPGSRGVGSLTVPVPPRS